MSDGLVVRFGFQAQQDAAVYSTPLSIASGDIGFSSPAVNISTSYTTTGTVPGQVPVAATYRLNFTTDFFHFQFFLCGSGNVIVTFDDPAIQQLSAGTIVVLQQVDDLNTFKGISFGASQTPIMTRNERGSLDSDQAPIPWVLGTTDLDDFFSGAWIAPNVNFGCTVYCY